MKSIINKLTYIKEVMLYRFNNDVLVKLVSNPQVDTMDETLDKLLDGYSISRYGDGEVDIMLNRSEGFQEPDKLLAKELRRILKKDFNEGKFIVGIPNIFEDLQQFTEEAQVHWKIRLNKERYKWYLLLNRNNKYANSQVTRFYFDWKDKNKSEEWIRKIKLIWENRKIVIVEGKDSRLGVGNDLFSQAISVERILCPNENAFNIYDSIKNEVCKQSKDKLILIALGPTATILAHDLYLKGYQAIDIGHIDIEYEWFLMQTAVKVKIKGKYVNEVNDGNIIEVLKNEQYENEIIARIEQQS